MIKRITKSEYFIPVILFIITALVISLKSVVLPGGYFMPDFDDGVYLTVSKAFANGVTPYINFWDNKGPVFYTINAIGFKLGGEIGVWLINVLISFLIALFIYKAVKNLSKSRPISILIPIISLIFIGVFNERGITCEEPTLLFMVVSLFIFTKYIKNKKISFLDCIINGAMFAMAFLVRINQIVFFVALLIVYLILLIRDKKYLDILKYFGLTLLGIAIVAVPYIIYLANNNALIAAKEAIWDNMFNVGSYYGKSEQLVGGIRIINKLKWFIPIVLGYFIIEIYRWFKKDLKSNDKIILILMLLWFYFTWVTNSRTANSVDHYVLSYIPLLIIPLVKLMEGIIKTIDNKKENIVTGVLIATSILIVSPNIEQLATRITENLYTEGKEKSEEVKELEKIKKEDDTLAVLGWLPEVYYLTDIKPATTRFYFLDEYVFSKEYVETLYTKHFKEIIRNKPTIIIEPAMFIQKFYNDSYVFNELTAYEEYVNNNYTQYKNTGEFTIYLLKDR